MSQQLLKIKKFVLSNKNFFSLWIAQIFTQSAVSFVTITIGILSHEGTISESTKESAASIGIIVSFSMFPSLVLAPLAGVFADSFSKKRIMIISNLLRIFLLIGYILLKGWENATLSYFLILILSMILQFFIPAEGGLIPRIVDKKYIMIANSLFALTVYSTMAVGIAFSGIILNILGNNLMFVFVVILLFLSTYLVWKVKIEEEHNKKFHIEYAIKFVRLLFKSVFNGVVYAFQNKILRFSLIHLLILQSVALTLATIVFKIGNDIYGVSSRSAGLVIFLPIALGLVLGILLLNIWGRNKNRPNLILVGTIVSSLGLIFMVVISLCNGILEKYSVNRIVASLSLMFLGFSGPFLLIPPQTLIYENTKKEFRGRVLGIWVAFTNSLASLFALFMGILVDFVDNLAVAILFVAVADILYSIVIFYFLQNGKLQLKK